MIGSSKNESRGGQEGDARASLGLTWFLHLVVPGLQRTAGGQGAGAASEGLAVPSRQLPPHVCLGQAKVPDKKSLFTALPTQQSLNWKAKTLGALSTPNKQWVLGFKEHVTVTLMAHFVRGGMEGSPKVKRLN